jgi:hypothetical protein
MTSGAAAPGVLYLCTILERGDTKPDATTAVSLRPLCVIAPIPNEFSGFDESMGFLGTRCVLFRSGWFLCVEACAGHNGSMTSHSA